MQGSTKAGRDPQKFGPFGGSPESTNRAASAKNPTQPGSKTGSKFPTGKVSGSTQANVRMK